MLKKIQSIRIKLFLTLTLTITIIIISLIIINNVILEKFYIYSKQKKLVEAYNIINGYYNNSNETDLEEELQKLEIKNDFEILIMNDMNNTIYITNEKFTPTYMTSIIKKEFLYNAMLFSENKITINQSKDLQTGYNFIYLSSTLDNNYKLYIRVPIASIKESVQISNRFLQMMACFTIIVSGIIVVIISKNFTDPILQLNEIADKMSKLDFSTKYKESKANNEIDNLGRSINQMSNTLEKTIKQLKETNIELEKDIEKKSKTDEMRKQFISDVSHELKTPIALIQGYAEGLIDGIASTDEDKEYYLGVILDEANKMSELTHDLLDLSNLEYGKNNLNIQSFDICELISATMKKNEIIFNEHEIKTNFTNYDNNPNEVINVKADSFRIEQVLTNYINNALKNINDKKVLKISVEKNNDIARIKVFNTGEHISPENLARIWTKFYKIDSSRNREQSGSGIGLSLVKAIMDQHHNNYGVENVEDGVEFWFELNCEN